MTFDEWAKKYEGKYIDYDGVYGVQCVDLAKHYIKNVLGITPKSIGNAIEYYNKRGSEKYLLENFVWIDYSKGFVPQKGDLAVFTSKSGKGHISVCTGEKQGSCFYSFDQNYPKGKGEPMTKTRHTFSSLLGVLRPRKKASYYPKYKGKSASIVDALKSLGIESDFKARTRIAAQNGITSYTGTAPQNIALLTKLKRGTLIK